MKFQFVLLILCLSFLISCKSLSSYSDSIQKEKEYDLVEKEIEIGKSVFAKLVGKYGIVKNKPATEYLNKAGKSLALYCERQDIEYFFAILNSPQINAYALPGGYILISLGTLQSIDNEAQLLGILAHELGHINKKHVLKNVKIEVTPNFFEILARFLAGPRNVVTVAMNQISNKIEETLFMKGIDSESEYEADLYAINLLKMWNIEQKSYVSFFEKLTTKDEKTKLTELYKTHPDIRSRIDLLNKNISFDLPEKKNSTQFKDFKIIVENLK